MAVGTVTPAIAPDHPSEVVSYPASIVSAWGTACDAPETAESGDAVSGGKVVRPGSITRSEQKLVRLQSAATRMLISLIYADDATPSTDPVVRVFGRDKNGVWHLLADDDGNVELTLTTAAATDVLDDDATYHRTTPISVDLQGSVEVIVTVQTAFAVSGGSTDGSEIQVKLIN